MRLYSTPIVGVPMVEPENAPNPTDVLLGYEVLHDNSENKIFTGKPDPKRLNVAGWVSVVLCALCFWPLSCVPCFMTCSYTTCQRPVYGTPETQDDTFNKNN